MDRIVYKTHRMLSGGSTSVPELCMYFFEDKLLRMDHCNMYMKFCVEGR